MKKRFISILLTVLMVMSLVPGMALNTYAENAASTAKTAQTIDYTMEEGDFVLRICQKLGLNYYTCKQAIMILNNINDGQWGKLTVGRTLILPASDYDATLIANGHTVSNGNTSTTTAAAAQTTASTSSVSTAKTRDTIAYYLVPYTMSYGDTVSGVCANLGVNFNIFHEFIRQVNGVSSWSSVRAGQTLLIPTPVTPSVGTSCYAVMQHQVASNESAYGIATSNGINYNSAKNLLQVINLTDNLTSIQAGSNFYYPAATTILYPGTGASPTSSTTTTTTTTTDGNVTTTTTTVTSSKLYKLTSNMTSADGLMVFYVGEKSVNEARAGDVVTIVTQTSKNKAIQSLTVKNLDGTAEMRLNGDSFIMPSCDVRVDAVLTTGHNITLNANYSGKAAATVGGVSVSSAVKNAVVKIISSDPTYEVESVSAYYKRFSWLASRTELAITDNSFVMPDADVTVDVTLRPVTTYAFYARSQIRTQNGDVDSSAGGNFFLQVNGSSVTRAAKGVTVTVVPKANNGYQPCAMSVTDHNTGRAINIFNNTFTMPACDVDVTVVFVGKGNNIILRPANKGSVVSNPAGEAATGDTVTLTVYPESASYTPRLEITRNSDGLLVPYNPAKDEAGNVIENTFEFTMPEGGVTVTPTFLSNETFTLNAEFWFNYPDGTRRETEYKNCSIVASYRDPATGNLVKQNLRMTGDSLEGVPDGVNIDLRPDCSEGVAFIRYEIVTDGNDELSSELTNQANYYGYFEMPGRRSYEGRIVLRAYFETGKIAIRPAAVSGNGTVSFQVNGNSANTANPGDTVEIYLTEGVGYRFKHANYRSKLLVTRRDNGAIAVPLEQRQGTRQIMRDGVLVTENYTYYTFTMPAEGVDVRAIFDPAQFTLRMRTRLESDDPGVFSTDVNGRGFWQIALNGEAGIVDNDPTGTTVGVELGDSVVVAMTEAGYSQYDLVSFTINGYEYVADVLNYFYNFLIEGDRAQDLDIVATLRPKYPYSTVFYSLSASYDAYKGNVEFLLLDQFNGARSSTYSKDYQATFNANTNRISGNVRFVKNAFAGDWVAIIAAPNNAGTAYNVDVNDITITGADADRIVPVRVNNVQINRGNGDPVTVDLFVFRMPETDVGINVDFKSAERGIRVSVYDGDVRVTASGLVRLSLDGTTYRDVADGDSFGNVPYGTMVFVSSTEYAMAQGKSIKAFRIRSAGDPVPYYDYTGTYQFSMPNNFVELIINVGSGSNFDILNPIVTSAIYGSLQCVDLAGNIVTSADTGDEIHVYDIPDKGYARLKPNELKILGSNGMNIAEWVEPWSEPNADGQGTIDYDGYWRFLMPQGGVSIAATFTAIDDYTITFRIDGGMARIATSIGGWSAMTAINDGHTIRATAGQTIYVAPLDGYSFGSKGVIAANAPEQLAKVNNVLVQYTVPELSRYGGTETLAIFVEENEQVSEDANIVFNAPNCTYVLRTGDTADSPIAADPKVGDLVYMFISVNTGYTLDEQSITVEALTDTEFETKSGWNPIGFTVPEGGVLVSATTTPKTPTITLKISNLTSGTTAKPKVKITIDDKAIKNFGNDEKFEFTYGQTVMIEPVGDFAWDTNNPPEAEKGKFEVKNKAVYYVSNGKDDTLTIKLKYTGKASNVVSNEAEPVADAVDEAPAEEVTEIVTPTEQAAPAEQVEQTAEEQTPAEDSQTLTEDFFEAANRAAEEAAADAASN